MPLFQPKLGLNQPYVPGHGKQFSLLFGNQITNGLSTLFTGSSTVDLSEPADMLRNFGTTEVTLAAWIYPIDVTNGGYVIAKANPSNIAGGQPTNHILGLLNNGSFFGYFGNISKTTQSNPGVIPLNSWSLLALTVTNISGAMTGNLWLNGVKHGSDVAAPGTGTAPGIPLRIGSGYQAASDDKYGPFSGSIDEVTFWSVGLSSADLIDLYNSGHPIDPRTHPRSGSLIHYFRMGDGPTDSFPLIRDLVGVTTGTCVGMASAARNFTPNTP